MIAPILAVQDLVKTVRDATGELEILRGLGFCLQRGQSVAIRGASGCGKSTLLSIVAGLDTPSSGTVLVDGEDFFAQGEDARARRRAQRMGFVFQNFQLLAHMNALENVMLPLELKGERSAAEKATAMLVRVGLQERLRHYPRFLSGGEQQRVALARALVVEPALLLADEPTGSLDHATGERVMGLMFDLIAERGTALLMVTHDERVASGCERTLLMHRGQFEEHAA